MLRIVICDDEPGIVLSLVEMIDRYWTVPHRTQGLFSAQALERYLTVDAPGQTDLLLLDVELGAADGIQLSRGVLERWPRMKVIFITGYAEYCQEIFQGKPSGFLLKPVKPEKLCAALDQAAKVLEEDRRQQLAVLDRERHSCQIPLEEIRYLESSGRLVRIVTGDRVVETYHRLGELEHQLSSGFVRCHQSYLVNLAWVQRLEGARLLLEGGETVPVSRSRAKETRQSLLRFAGEHL